MGKLLDELKTEVAQTFRTTWSRRDGRVVPEPSDLKLGNDAIEFDRATILYADLAGSTKMVDAIPWQAAAEVYKSFLHCASRLIRDHDGVITSYDGDRVMGVFVGDSQSNQAVKCALKINYAVQNVVSPAVAAQYPNYNLSVKQVVGVDTSPIRAARTGVRGDNDIVWVGRAANYAAKLTDLDLKERTWITEAVFEQLVDAQKFASADRALMWKKYSWSQNGDISIYGSTYWWAF
jgi:class 3 adenylate cyclase